MFNSMVKKSRDILPSKKHIKILFLIIAILITVGCQQNNVFSENERDFSKGVKLSQSNNVQNKLISIQLFEKVGDHRSIGYLIKLLDDPNYDVRIASLQTLVKMQEINSLDLVMKKLSDREALVREKAKEAIKSFGDKAVIPIMKQTQNPDKTVKINAIRALSITEATPAIDILGRIALDNKDPEIRIEAINALSTFNNDLSNFYVNKCLNDRLVQVKLAALSSVNKSNNPELVMVIAPMLEDSSDSIVLAAIDALASTENEKAASILINKLIQNATVSRYTDRITQALPKVGSMNNVSNFLAALEDPQQPVRFSVLKAATLAKDKEWAKTVITTATQNSMPEIKNMAIFALKDTDVQQSMPQILAALKDPDASIRANAIKALAETPNAEANKDQFLTLLKDPEVSVQIATIQALSKVKSDWAFLEFKNILSTATDTEVKVAVLESLSDFKKEYKVASLIASYLNDSEVRVGDSAANSLIKVGGLWSRNYFVSNLRDPNPVVKIRCIRSLNALGDYTVVDSIMPLLADENPDVKMAAKATAAAMLRRKQFHEKK